MPSEVHARILLWGIEGSGKTTTLETIRSKLRSDLRGELRMVPTRLDPTIHFESLTISLGEVGDVSMQIEIIGVPGAPDQAMTRKQLLDEVDGVVIIVDASPERINSNYTAIDELRASLASYGRRLDALPVVVQYNKRDIADPFAIEEFHRRINLKHAAVFETIATTGHHILHTLTTISKHVIRAHRSEESPNGHSPGDLETMESNGSSHEILEAAILAEGEEDGLDDIPTIDLSSETQPDWGATRGSEIKTEDALGAEFRIVSVGEATLEADGGVRFPLVLGDGRGQTRTVVLSLRLDPLVAGTND